MSISLLEAKNVLNTLPISYYLKRKISISIENVSCSYFDPMNDTIVISLVQINNSLSQLDNISKDDIEFAIRCMCYHEVSHALLTPKTLRMETYMNIFEDERIESLLRAYYIGVNFRKFVKMVNNYTGEAAKSPDEAYYHLVRYRIGNKYWLNRLSKLIQQYSEIKSTSLSWIVDSYSKDVYTFYRDFVKAYTDSNDSTNEDIDKQSNEDCKNTCGDLDNSEVQDSDESINEKIEDSKVGELTGLGTESYENNEKLTNSEIIELTKHICDKYVNKKVINDFMEILKKSKISAKNNSSAINGYSGMFHPRSVMRDDYKYFIHENRLGNVRAYSKIRLNLFIDRSGSFRYSEGTVNEILHALTLIEKQNDNFTFTFTTLGRNEILHDKNDRVLHCSGGNTVTEKIHSIFKGVQSSNALNTNIVLFDGDAFSDGSGSKNEKNMSAFNHKNVLIISDYENETVFNKHCKNAKRIYTNNYCEELYSNLIKTLITFI